MKILRPGKTRLSVMRGECGHCGCSVECHPTEPRRAIANDGALLCWVSCPMCFRNLYVTPAEPTDPT